MKAQKNTYLKHTHLAERVLRRLIHLFALDLSSYQAAAITHINRKTVQRIFKTIRMKIATQCERDFPFQGEVELDESFFGPKRVPGKRGLGAGKKTIVFGLFKRGGKVYTQIVPDVQKPTLLAIIRGKIDLHSTLYTDGWRSYDGLVDVGYDKHLRTTHRNGEYVDPKNPRNHVNGIESFWSYTKRRYAKSNGVPRSQFYLFLKETEFRFNHRNDNLYLTLLKLMKKRP